MSSKSSGSRSRTPSESSELSSSDQRVMNNNGHVAVPRMSLDSGDVAEVDSDEQTNVQTFFTVMETR